MKRKVSENARKEQMKKYETETLPVLYNKTISLAKESSKVGNNSFVFSLSDTKSPVPVPASTDNIYCGKIHTMCKREFTKKRIYSGTSRQYIL